MYKYQFNQEIVKYIKKKRRNTTYFSTYNIFEEYFKIKPSADYFSIHNTFSNNIDYTFYSKKQLTNVPFSGFLFPVSMFKETK